MRFMRNIFFGLMAIILSACQTPSGEMLSITFDEPKAPQPVSPVPDWEGIGAGLNCSWGNTNLRYHKEYIPDITIAENYRCSAWKNERVYAQFLVWSKDQVDDLSIEISALKSDAESIEPGAIEHFFIRSVLADEFLNGCGEKTKSPKTAYLLPDCLERVESFTKRSNSTRGIWLNINIPESAKAGYYVSELAIKINEKVVKTLTLEVDVLDRHLPSPHEWAYHLDLWQNPFAVARVHDVELWSEEHFELMGPLYEMLADAGQKCITTSILHKPWGGQTYDYFHSMIRHTLDLDGEWKYDYTHFDNWVEFMMGLGINKQIDCYSLIPWGNQLHYYDESADRDTMIQAKASSVEFADYWTPFLKDFTFHLKEKGWFDIATIAMDERSLDDMQSAISLIKKHSGLRISSAANYNAGVSDDIYNLSPAVGHLLPPQIIKGRRERGQITTFYVCCAHKRPNNFTFSPLAEGVWQAWFAYAKNLDGFLRWAYNSWVEDPLHDSRFMKWPSGDTYFVYPEAKSSIRFEKLREGIQDYEKLRILTAELHKDGSPASHVSLEQIQEVLQGFTLTALEEQGAEALILRGKALLDDLTQN